jgi:hypothetical protein
MNRPIVLTKDPELTKASDRNPRGSLVDRTANGLTTGVDEADSELFAGKNRACRSPGICHETGSLGGALARQDNAPPTFPVRVKSMLLFIIQSSSRMTERADVMADETISEREDKPRRKHAEMRS